MNVIAKKYIKLIDAINNIFGYVISIVLAFMAIIIFWQVFARFVMGDSLSWSEELSRFLMIFMIFIGCSIAVREGRMIAVDVIYERISLKTQKVIKILVHLISIVFYIILINFGYNLAESFGNQIAPGTNISMYFIYLSIPIGGILLFANSLANILEEFVGKG